jgi:hypothetical protein
MANMRTRDAGVTLTPPALNPEFWILVGVVIKMYSVCLAGECRCLKQGNHAKIGLSLRLKAVSNTVP